MDPLAHTLVGASLAATRLGQRATLGTPILILAANAPDIDAVTMLIDRDLSLGFRRGWTHGVLALIVLPIVVAALVCLIDRIVARARGRPRQTEAGPVLVLAAIGVLSHPLLDWLNTYGMRFLMPFDGRWFYGDALFIVDPWVWLLASAGVVLAHSRSRLSIAAWIALGLAATIPIVNLAAVPPAARLLWLAGLAAIGAARMTGPGPGRAQRVSTVALICAAIYMLAMVWGSKLAVRQATEWLAARDSVPVEVMAGPVPANPFVRDVIVVDADHYHFLEVNWLRQETITVSSPAVDRRPPDRIVEAALAAPSVQGVRQWLRFPAYTVDELTDGYRVLIQDVRYSRRRGLSFPNAVVELDRNLHPR